MSACATGSEPADTGQGTATVGTSSGTQAPHASSSSTEPTSPGGGQDAGLVDATTTYPSADATTFILPPPSDANSPQDAATGVGADGGSSPSPDAGELRDEGGPPMDAGAPPPPVDAGGPPSPDAAHPPLDAASGGTPACGSSPIYVAEATAALMASPEPVCASGDPECPATDCKYTAIPFTCLCLAKNPF